MKVLTAQFIFESNTFNPAPAGLELFARGGTWLTEEPRIRAWCAGTDSQLAGSIAVLEAAGCEVHPVFVATCGTPAGRLSPAAFDAVKSGLLGGLRRAGPADVLLLHLHGAACAEREDDVEGALLAAVRTELGFHGRIVVSLDLHANITRKMLQNLDALTAYRTMPHTDFRATGERAAQIVLAGEPTRRTLVKLAAILPPTDTDDSGGRFADVLAQARELERQPGIIDVSLFPVQPWLDVAEMGSSVVVTSLPDAPALAGATALAERWYGQRHAWRHGLRTWEEIFTRLGRRGPRPWILVDTSDATSAGSDGRSAEAIVRLWSRRDALVGEVLLWVVDPAARAAIDAGAGSVRLGNEGFEVTGERTFSGEGRYRARGRAYTGHEFSMGRSVVVAAGQLRIVISDTGALCADPAFYECVGLDPSRALAVLAKSMMGWRAGFEAPVEDGLYFDGPGVASLNFARLLYTGARRRLFPVDPNPPEPISAWQSN